MNLLNSTFNTCDMEIVNTNKKYFIFTIVVLVITISLLMIKKDNYYSNNFSVSDNEVVLLADKKLINKIKEAKKIIISDIENSYSINTITALDNSFLINIDLGIKVKNITSGIYKIYLGKERIFDYIIRIISNGWKN